MSDEFPKVGTRGLKPGESILNPDGSRSSERTISVGFDDGIHLIPTIVPDEQGFLVKRSNEEAIELFRQGKNPSRGLFKTEKEATAFAKQRSEKGGRFSNFTQQDDLNAKMVDALSNQLNRRPRPPKPKPRQRLGLVNRSPNPPP